MANYTITFLIDKLYSELNEINAYDSKNKKLVLNRPIIKSANKRTFISNFKEICNSLNRNIDDVKTYFEKELATTVTINQDGGLVITGMYKQNGVMKIMESYIQTYVMCKECKTYSTDIVKENRITFMKCNRCYSKKTLN